MNIMTAGKVFRILLLSSLPVVMMSPADAASVGGHASAAFSKGSSTYNIAVGSGRSFNNNYTILGLGISYYVADGLELGIDAQHWFSGKPAISQVSPQVRYVFTRLQTVKPYVGTFYRRTYIEDYDDTDSYGYRAGAYVSGSNGVYIGGGIVYEEYKDCEFDDCSTSYPELIMSVSF